MVSICLSNYSDDEKKEIMSLWGKITFRIYGLFDKDSRNCVGDYVSLAGKIYNGLKFENAKKELENIGSSYPIEDIIGVLKGKNWYHDYSDQLKYILYRYEKHLVESDGGAISDITWGEIWSDTPANTIEHVIPKTYNDVFQKNWNLLNVNCQDDLDRYVHNIGNLTLLPPKLNSRLGQKSFKEKKKEYKNYTLRITKSIEKKNVNGEKKKY